MALAIAAARSRRPSVWLTLMALAVASTQFGLPRFERWTNPAFRLQFIVTAVCLIAVVVLGVGLRLAKSADAKALAIAMAALPVLTIVPVTGFLAVRPFIETLYRDTLAPGLAFEAFRGPFEAAGHTVLTPDLRGHGDDDRPGAVAGVSMTDYARDIAELCAGLPEPPILIGHSLGGLVAQLAAKRTPPKALILLAPSPPWGVAGSSMELSLIHI